MYPLNDNDLDRLSRDAAEHYDVESSAAGWEALEKRLDRELPHKAEKDRKRFLFWLFFIAVMTGGTLIWMLNGNTPSNALAQNKTQQKNNIDPTSTVANDSKAVKAQQDDIKTTNPDIASNNKTTGKPTAETEKIDGSNTETNKSSIAVKQKSAANPNTVITKTGDNNNSVTPSITVRGRQKLIASTFDRKPKKQATVIKSKKTSSPEADKDVAAGDNNDKTTDNNQAEPKKDNDQPVNNNTAVTEEKSTDKTDKGENKSIEETKPTTETADTKKGTPLKGSVKSPLELGVVVGPDLTSVKFKYFDKTGFSAGLTIGYRLSNRWSLNTGLIYTKKNYKAAGEDFTPPKHYWTNYVQLDNLQGNCSMWEVPLNVRYDLSTGKQRWFASTGLSTYFMTHQYYDYYYYNSSGTYSKYGWETDSNSHYLLSVVNLSFGYERSIGKQFSIQAEPYLKIPLKGIGFGNMDMDSYGLYLSLKYRPQFKTKK